MARLRWSIKCRTRLGTDCTAQIGRSSRGAALEHFQAHYKHLQLDTLRSAEIPPRLEMAIDEKEWARERAEEHMWRQEEQSPYEPGSIVLKPKPSF